MAKLYAPQIPGTLPAFYGVKDSTENVSAEIKIPFSMNRAVGFDDISGFCLLIKDIQKNTVIETYYTSKSNSFLENGINIIKFNIDKVPSQIKIGNFYKVQLAYYQGDKDSKIIGYYSTVGIIKYTGTPTVSINNLGTSTVNSLVSNQLIGSYSNSDLSEKIYSYKFVIKDLLGNTFEESDEILHNHQDSDFQDIYTIKKELKDNIDYTIKYIVTTVNNLVIASPEYKIIKNNNGIYPFSKIVLYGNLNRENAYIKLDFSKSDKELQSGKFFISKSSSKDQFSSWERIYNFELVNSSINDITYKDFNIEFGETYQYAVQQYSTNNNIESKKIMSNSILVYFDHIYLYDGQRQLKIEYNPKVTSIKENILESKTDTLGGKYPHFFRNGQVRYKEFPISGLISYLSDDEELFISKKELGLDKQFRYGLEQLPTTNLVDYNIKAESIFKFNVLDFLNNGKPKIFKSPIENNYLVRLINSSLSPNEQLGRMLHTFSATAIEFDELSLNNLFKYQILNQNNNIYSAPPIPYFKTFDLLKTQGIENCQIFYLSCQDVKPGTNIKYKKNNEDELYSITIGQSSNYILELEKDNYITWLDLENNTNSPGFITIGYYNEQQDMIDKFTLINKIEYKTIPLIQNDIQNSTNEIIGANKIKINGSEIDLTHTYNFKIENLPGDAEIIIGENIQTIASIEKYIITYTTSPQTTETGISNYNFIEFYLGNIEREGV